MNIYIYILITISFLVAYIIGKYVTLLFYQPFSIIIVRYCISLYTYAVNI